MNLKETTEILAKELRRKDYSERTVTIYSSWLRKLSKFYPDKKMNQITFEEIDDYLMHLKDRLAVAASSINQALQSYNFLYNKIWGLNYNFSKVDKPIAKRSDPEILSIEEILEILEATKNLQHKLLIAVAYSAGLELFETKNLKISEIDLNRDIIRVKDSKGRVNREAVLSRYVKMLLLKHLKINKPKTYLFESSQTGKKYGDTTMRQILVNQVVSLGIKKKIVFKTLKYSYIVHLEQLGRPLQYTLEDLQMTHPGSLVFYEKLKNKNIVNKRFSPLDKISLHKEVEHPINRDYFEQIISEINNSNESEYLKEALTCLSAGSFRAGVIFTWNAAVMNLRKKCFAHGKSTLNSFLTKHDQKARVIKNEDDFAYIKDSTLLKIAQDLGEIDKGEKDSLEDCLDLRNKCGHPGKYKPKSLKVSSFMEELINIIFVN